jgi:outer membrane lipoprotein LolB
MPLSPRRIHYMWLIAALYLSGCATPITQTKPANTVKPSVLHMQHMEHIAQIQQFALKGRLGVLTKPKSFSASLVWQHIPEKDNVDVYSPLGGKVANITKTPEQVTLTDNKEELITEKDVETLTENTLGFRLPLAGLSYWALGKPSNEGIVNVMTWDENGRVKTLQQNGWIIEYNDYSINEEYTLPNKMVLKNDQITIKLIVDKWLELK